MTTGDEARATILLVDDFRDMVMATRIFLEGEGYRVLEAYDGVQCLEILERVTPDLIILDVMMPRLDGWATLTRIQADERWKCVPVLMLTALNDPVNVKIGGELGCTWYYTKPVTDYCDFARVIERILSGSDVPEARFSSC